MELMKIIDKANELTLDKFNFGMKIIFSFIVVDALMLMVGFTGIYQENVSEFIDPVYGIIIGMIFAIFSSILMCIGLTRSILNPLGQFDKAAKKICRGGFYSENMLFLQKMNWASYPMFSGNERELKKYNLEKCKCHQWKSVQQPRDYQPQVSI